MNKSRKPASIPRHFKHGETQYHNRILAVTNEAAARLLRSADLQEELPEILQILGSALGLTACAIVKTIASDHFGDGADIFLEWQNPSTPKIDLLKLTGFLLSEKKLTSQDLFLNSNAFPENSTSFPPLSIAFIPLFEADHTWGFIGLLTPETHPGWIPAQREAIQTIANIIGAALQRQSSAEHSRAILTALPDLIICMDQFGNILEYSARKNHPLYRAKKRTGRNYQRFGTRKLPGKLSAPQIANLSFPVTYARSSKFLAATISMRPASTQSAQQKP
jgi:hypothetical protein